MESTNSKWHSGGRCVFCWFICSELLIAAAWKYLEFLFFILSVDPWYLVISYLHCLMSPIHRKQYMKSLGLICSTHQSSQTSVCLMVCDMCAAVWAVLRVQPLSNKAPSLTGILNCMCCLLNSSLCFSRVAQKTPRVCLSKLLLCKLHNTNRQQTIRTEPHSVGSNSPL